jgi:succinyl-diaminopimelate desuccinylase
MVNTPLKQEIEGYFGKRREDIVESIRRLIAIRSVNSTEASGMPYGPGPAAALKAALLMAEGLGLHTQNAENYAGTADLNGLETKLGILVHLDVVPEGENWSTDPYEGVVKDGKLYGRGASDDKGPAVAALFALAAVRDLGIELESNVRLILGTDEESGSRDLRYYFTHHPVPPYLFTADGEFPVLNTEKGGLFTSFSAAFVPGDELPAILYARGGNRSNVVPAEAEALLRGIDPELIRLKLDEAASVTGAEYRIEPLNGQDICIRVTGKSAHASEPRQGTNAVTALLTLLSALPLPDSPGHQALQQLSRLFPHGDVHGQAAGIAMEDEVSGKLTVNLAILNYTPEQLNGVLDCRLPLCATQENTERVLSERLHRMGMELNPGGYSPAHHTPADSPFVQLLLSAYEEYSGKKGECMATGGWTYVHGIAGAVNFGPAMQGTPTAIHGPDEFAVIEDLLTAAKIYTQVIIDICSRKAD